jgi:hypothetical protein
MSAAGKACQQLVKHVSRRPPADATAATELRNSCNRALLRSAATEFRKRPPADARASQQLQQSFVSLQQSFAIAATELCFAQLQQSFASVRLLTQELRDSCNRALFRCNRASQQLQQSFASVRLLTQELRNSCNSALLRNSCNRAAKLSRRTAKRERTRCNSCNRALLCTELCSVAAVAAGQLRAHTLPRTRCVSICSSVAAVA